MINSAKKSNFLPNLYGNTQFSLNSNFFTIMEKPLKRVASELKTRISKSTRQMLNSNADKTEKNRFSKR